jgi:cell division protein YceG involved in septum cleavage
MKKLYDSNRTLFILISIALVCILISVVLLFKYFYFGNGETKYGDRLDGIENVQISDADISDIKSNIESNKLVSSASVNVTGKIVYIKINFKESASLVEAESVAVKSLDKFSESEKAFYDFEFTLYQDATEKTEGFRIMGAKNVNGSNLVWNNNNATSSSDGE